MRCADADAQVRSPTLLPSNRRRRHYRWGAGVESETPSKMDTYPSHALPPTGVGSSALSGEVLAPPCGRT